MTYPNEYIFSWCTECDALEACYYQHGIKEEHPCALDPDCAHGPLKELSLSEFPLLDEEDISLN